MRGSARCASVWVLFGCFYQSVVLGRVICSEQFACRGTVELDFFYPSPAPTEDKRAVDFGFSRSFRWPCSGHPSSQLSLLAHQLFKFIDLLAELLQLQELLGKLVLRRGLV